jgi:hypothetical protein
MSAPTKVNIYTLLQFPIPGRHTELINALHLHLDYCVEANVLLSDGIHPITGIDDVFDLKNNNEVKTIAIKLNPYKRIVLWFKYVVEKGIMYGYGNIDYSSYKKFSDFVDYYLSDAIPPEEGALLNMVDLYYADGLEPNYLLEFDTLATDIKQIPEFANVENTDYLAQDYQDSLDYKSYYDDSTKAKVEAAYAKDFAKFGYTF